MLRKPGHKCSLMDEIAVYRRHMEALLLLLPKKTPTAAAAAAAPPPPNATTNAAVGNVNAEVPDETTPHKSRREEAGTATGGGGVEEFSANSGNTTTADSTRGREGVDMIVYFVLERCSVLADAGYTLQAAAEALGAVGGDRPLRGWDTPDGEGPGTSLLRAPSTEGVAGGRLPKVRIISRRTGPDVFSLFSCLRDVCCHCARWRHA